MTLYIDYSRQTEITAISILKDGKFTDIDMEKETPQGIALDLISAPRIISFGNIVPPILRMIELDSDDAIEIKEKTFNLQKMIWLQLGFESALTKVAEANFGTGYLELIKKGKDSTPYEVFQSLHSRLNILKVLAEYGENSGTLKVFKAGKQYTAEVAFVKSP